MNNEEVPSLLCVMPKAPHNWNTNAQKAQILVKNYKGGGINNKNGRIITYFVPQNKLPDSRQYLIDFITQGHPNAKTLFFNERGGEHPHVMVLRNSKPHGFHQNYRTDSQQDISIRLPGGNANKYHIYSFVLYFGDLEWHSQTFTLPKHFQPQINQFTYNNLNQNVFLSYCPPQQGMISIFPSETWHAVGETHTKSRFIVTVRAILPMTWKQVYKKYSELGQPYSCVTKSVRNITTRRQEERRVKQNITGPPTPPQSPQSKKKRV